MSKGRKNIEMLSREKLLPPTNQACIKFISDKEMHDKFKNIDFFASRHISVPKK